MKNLFIGKWNKSVVLTYLGVVFSVVGIYFALYKGNILFALSCLMCAGVCDAFDGTVARMCKRSEEEKEFGVQLDSLCDVVDFVILPICIFIGLKFVKCYHILIYVVYAICGVARLAYFNVVTADSEKAIKHYSGLPVTTSAAIFPLFYLLKYVIPSIFSYIYIALMLLVAILFVLNIKIKKPKKSLSFIFSIGVLVMHVIYYGVLK